MFSSYPGRYKQLGTYNIKGPQRRRYFVHCLCSCKAPVNGIRFLWLSWVALACLMLADAGTRLKIVGRLGKSDQAQTQMQCVDKMAQE